MEGVDDYESAVVLGRHFYYAVGEFLKVVDGREFFAVGDVEGLLIGNSIVEEFAFPAVFFVGAPEDGALASWAFEEVGASGYGEGHTGGEAGFAGFWGAGEDDEAAVGKDSGDEPGFSDFGEVLIVGGVLEGD